MAPTRGAAMDFFKLIQSLDELIYEVVGWLLFYPMTLWRTISAPLATMKAAERELAASELKPFNDRISPPLFLLITLILLHAVELATVGESAVVTSERGFRGLIDDDTNLIIFRVLMFSILPLSAAVRLIQAEGAPLDRESLRPPFYAQCYAVAVFALLSDAAIYIVENGFTLSGPAFFVSMALSLAWLFVVETRWFAAELKGSLVKGAGEAALMIGQWIILLVPIWLLLS